MTALKTRAVLWRGLAIGVAVSLIYGGLWAALAVGARGMANEWIAAQRQAGWSMSASAPRFNGFPGWPRVVLENIAVTAPLEEGGWSWAAERVELIPAAFDLTRLTVRAPDRHMVDAPWSPGGPLTAEASRADLELDLDTAGRLQRTRFTLENGEIQDSSGLPLFGAAWLDLELALADKTVSFNDVFATFRGRSEGLRLALNLRPFAREIRALHLDADLIGDLQPGRLQDAVDAWRRGGGTLEVRRLLLDWPPLSIEADGTLALDDRLQPIAAFSTRITGFGDTLRALEAQGMMEQGQAASAQLVLNMLATTPPGRDVPELQVPVSVQDQRLSVGPFEVMDVPTIRWE